MRGFGMRGLVIGTEVNILTVSFHKVDKISPS